MKHRIQALGLLLVTALATPAAGQGCLWNPAADAPIARLEGPTSVIDGRMLVFGGFVAGLAGSSRVDAYDPATDTWTQLGDLPAPITHAGWAVDDRTIWAVGGFLGDHPGPVVDDVWIYDVDLDAWSAGPPLPEPRGSGGLFRLGRDLHYVGGVSVDRDTDEDDHWVLDLDDPASGWIPSTPLPVARNHFATIAVGGRGYVIGGQFGHDVQPMDSDLLHVWDPQTGWSQAANLPFPRSHCEPGTFELNGRIIVGGGRANTLGLASVADISAYDPILDAWSPLPPLPGPLLAPCIEAVGGEIVVACGGPSPSLLLNETWRRPDDAGFPLHLRVNAGGGALALTDPWCPDVSAVGGQSFSNPSLGDVANTFDDELYQTERSGSNAVPGQFDYAVPLEDGSYRVRLHFAEIYWGAPGGGTGGAGKRVFDVSLEGQLALDDYDIFADVGAAAAVVHTFDVAVSGGALDMSFDASVDRPKLSGFEVIALGSGGNYCVGAPNSAGPGAAISWGGSTSVSENALTLMATGCPPGQSALFLQSPGQIQMPLGSGFLCVGPGAFRLPPVVFTDVTGAVVKSLDLLAPNHPAAQIDPGSTWNFQLWYRDVPQTTNLTDGLSLTFVP